MIAQRLDRVLSAFRIGDPNGDFPIYDATGSTLAPGRWNDAESPMIYAAEHYSTAMLEKLLGLGGKLPPNQHYIEITLPNGLSYEVFEPRRGPGWDADDNAASRTFGVAWHRERRSAALIVPSVIAPIENNILINPGHPEASQIRYSLHRPVWSDRRLFSGAKRGT